MAFWFQNSSHVEFHREYNLSTEMHLCFVMIFSVTDIVEFDSNLPEVFTKITQ